MVTCTNDDGDPHGATVNAFTAVSLEPALCQVTLTRNSRACGYLENAPFAVNVLGQDQVDTAWHFAGRPADPPPHGPTVRRRPSSSVRLRSTRATRGAPTTAATT